MNEELLASIFLILKGYFVQKEAQSIKTLHNNIFLQHGSEGIYGIKHQLASDKVTNSLYSLPSVHSC